ncbi:glycosyltransferase family 4 protein [Liquorilactobacillus capillatus]|uniref:Glycosyltransferase n=1 Tax=Liquorilactobacillus capillatus DSM 19910 TaxID=1423731 RepID=A0A0R1ME66_9LACO|nr:glycosyltransferase family 4 protein [Liquorilactobacillus capillatus]KRL02603.1 glycosyltransferase [Liquorilactobacillus capillatus DSM 19910]
MNIAIIVPDSNGGYPVPASKGGAVSQLVEQLVKNNEREKKAELSIFTFFEKKAFNTAKKYNNTKFYWTEVPNVIKLFDKILFFIVSKFFKNKKSISYRSVFSMLYMLFKVHIDLRKRNFDAVIIENNMIFCNVFRNLKTKYSEKYYVHLHNVPRINGKCKKIIQEAKKIICVSNYVGEQVAKSNSVIGPISKKKITTCYNCVDTKVFRQIKKTSSKLELVRDKYDIKENCKVVVYAGRLSPEKGVDRLLEAVKLFPENEDIVVLIIGSLIYDSDLKDSYYYSLKEIADDINNNSRKKIFFTGYIPNNDLVYMYNIADVSILPSVWEEPAGLTMLESIACGTPVITTDVGGIPEYVSDCGIIVENNYEKLPKLLSEAYIRITRDSIFLDNIVNKGLQKIESEFNSEEYLDNFLSSL